MERGCVCMPAYPLLSGNEGYQAAGGGESRRKPPHVRARIFSMTVVFVDSV